MEPYIHAYLRAAIAHDRRTERIGPFLVALSPENKNPYLNYAIPDDRARPSAADVASLVRHFRAEGRRPRLEYLPEASPHVEEALLDAGFAAEGRLPVMTCRPEDLLEAPCPEGIVLLEPVTDGEILDLKAAQSEAYGEGPPDAADVAAGRRFRDRGGIACLAREWASGVPAGGGGCTVPACSVTEVAGVGVRPEFRRRGIARALTRWLCAEAFGRGVRTAWLTPAGQAEERVYAAVGFRSVSEALHISLPDG